MNASGPTPPASRQTSIRSPETCLDLIGKREDIVLPADGRRLFEEARRRNENASLALDRLREKR